MVSKIHPPDSHQSGTDAEQVKSFDILFKKNPQRKSNMITFLFINPLSATGGYYAQAKIPKARIVARVQAGGKRWGVLRLILVNDKPIADIGLMYI